MLKQVSGPKIHIKFLQKALKIFLKTFETLSTISGISYQVSETIALNVPYVSTYISMVSY